MLYKIGGLITGTAIGTTFVCQMDDVIYGQLQRHMIYPVKQVLTQGNANSFNDLYQVGSGTANFVSQFKPHGLGRTHVRDLIV